VQKAEQSAGNAVENKFGIGGDRGNQQGQGGNPDAGQQQGQ
jgi:hypothetical protein